MNDAAVNRGLQSAPGPTFNSFEIPSNGIDGPNGNPGFTFVLRKHHPGFHSSYTTSYSPQYCTSTWISPRPRQHLCSFCLVCLVVADSHSNGCDLIFKRVVHGLWSPSLGSILLELQRECWKRGHLKRSPHKLFVPCVDCDKNLWAAR